MLQFDNQSQGGLRPAERFIYTGVVLDREANPWSCMTFIPRWVCWSRQGPIQEGRIKIAGGSHGKWMMGSCSRPWFAKP